jgi:hypothetical protein
MSSNEVTRCRPCVYVERPGHTHVSDFLFRKFESKRRNITWNLGINLEVKRVDPAYVYIVWFV